jgi:hypothetical protein
MLSGINLCETLKTISQNTSALLKRVLEPLDFNIRLICKANYKVLMKPQGSKCQNLSTS